MHYSVAELEAQATTEVCVIEEMVLHKEVTAIEENMQVNQSLVD